MKIYVGNLSWQSRENDLTDLFAPFGEIESVAVIMERDNPNRSRGIAFVTMPNDEDAKRAIAALNNTEFMGRNIIANEAKPMGDRPPRRDFRSGGNQRGNFRPARREF